MCAISELDILVVYKLKDARKELCNIVYSQLEINN